MLPFEIHDAAHPFNKCNDRRPWLVVDVREGGVFGCFPISGECYSGSRFQLSCEHPDFATTGLNKTCYILDDRIYEIETGEFAKYRGRLAGDLRVSFLDYAGLDPSATDST